MDTIPSLEEFSSFELFCELEQEELKMVVGYLTPSCSLQELKAHDSIIQPGETCRYIILVLDGVIKAVQYTQDGKELVGNIFTRGKIFGCIEIITGNRIHSYVKAERDSSLLLFPLDPFKNILKNNLALKEGVIRYMAACSENFVAHSFILKQKKACDRITLHLLHHISHSRNKTNGYEFSFTIELFARYLNLTRSVLSKELHALQRKKIITLGKNIIYIKDQDALLQGDRKA